MGPTSKPSARVRAMFQRIAPRYDLMNRLMSLGQDERWRRAVVRRVRVPRGGRLLDVGAGTGGIARAAAVSDPALRVVAADFTPAMMAVGRNRLRRLNIRWCAADAQQLPFRGASFDAVVSGYLIRNVSDARAALQEQLRVLRPGGRMACLETAPRPRGALRPVVRVYLDRIIPVLGQLITGSRAAYRYPPDSTRSFMQPSELAELMRRVGFGRVRARNFMLGTQVVIMGHRPRGARPGRRGMGCGG